MSAAQALAVLDRLRALGVHADDISADSRRAGSGCVFAAWPGQRTDGRRFLADAAARGVAAVLWEDGDGFAAPPLAVPGFGVRGLRELAGYLAHELHGRPSQALWLAGVTGTNGKTTVSQMLARALGELEARCGIVGTLGCGFPDALEEGLNTTPDALELHRWFARFRDQGAAAAAMEVSSIGLDQGRVNGAHFDVAIFTNGAIRHTAVIPIAGDQVTNDIATIFHAPTAAAEEIKIRQARCLRQLARPDEQIEVAGVGDRPARMIASYELVEVVQSRYEEFFDMARNELQRSGFKKQQIAAGVVLTGGSARMDGVLDLADEMLHMPVRLGVPYDVGGLDVVRDPACATAVGLLLFGN